MAYIGIKGITRLEQADSSLTLTKTLDEAKRMLRENPYIDHHFIKEQTGWELGVDKKWKYEISEPFLPPELMKDFLCKHFGEAVSINLLLDDFSFLVAYPELSELEIYPMLQETNHGYAGYCSGTKVIVTSISHGMFEETIYHEMQHFIQEIENFARGGSSSSVYFRLAGEVEARNVARRYLMTDEERRKSLRTDTQDVLDKDQVVRFV